MLVLRGQRAGAAWGNTGVAAAPGSGDGGAAVRSEAATEAGQRRIQQRARSGHGRTQGCVQPAWQHDLQRQPTHACGRPPHTGHTSGCGGHMASAIPTLPQERLLFSQERLFLGHRQQDLAGSSSRTWQAAGRRLAPPTFCCDRVFPSHALASRPSQNARVSVPFKW